MTDDDNIRYLNYTVSVNGVSKEVTFRYRRSEHNGIITWLREDQDDTMSDPQELERGERT